MKTSELTGTTLDWAVAQAKKIKVYRSKSGKWMTAAYGDFNHRHGAPWFSPSIDWLEGGWIIEREEIDVSCVNTGLWSAKWWANNSGMVENPAQRFKHNIQTYGPTPLIAAMRCYVASKLGDEVEIPEELQC